MCRVHSGETTRESLAKSLFPRQQPRQPPPSLRKLDTKCLVIHRKPIANCLPMPVSVKFAPLTLFKKRNVSTRYMNKGQIDQSGEAPPPPPARKFRRGSMTLN